MLLPMIDWLSVTVDIDNYEIKVKELVSELEQLKSVAADLRSNHKQDKVLCQIGNQTFEILPNGAIGYGFILHNALMELKLAKFRSKNKETYPIFVHFKSEFLWSVGPENVWYWFLDWVNNLIGPVSKNKLNRTDLCCHTDIICLGVEDIDSFKGRYHRDRFTREHRNFTGFEFGSRKTGTIFSRIYNKTQEVLAKKN